MPHLLDSIADGFLVVDPQGRILYANPAAQRTLSLDLGQILGKNYWEVFDPGRNNTSYQCFRRAITNHVPVEFEQHIPSSGRWIQFKMAPTRDGSLSVLLSDITSRKTADQEHMILLNREREARAEAEALSAISRDLVGELDLEALVQRVTDAATRLTGAAFGAFFYNVVNDRGESYLLYTLSGAPREAFAHLGLPRNTPIFDPTFRGTSVIRSDDIRQDPRYGTLAPHHGMPEGHLAVRSYLAAPVVSRSGEVLGGLFFGHPQTRVFGERSERIAVAIAAQAAVAIDNSRLFNRVEREIEQRRRTEERLRMSEQRFRAIVETSPECVKVVAADGSLLHINAAGLALLDAESLDQVVGKSVYPLIVPEHRDRYRAFNQRVCRGEKGSLEFDIVGLKGRRLAMESHAVPFRDHDGAVVQLALTRNVTERNRRAQAAWLLAAIVDSSDDAIVSKDLNGIIMTWNHSAERLFGYTAAEVIGKSITILIPPDRQDEEPAILERLRRGQHVDHFETIRRRKDGTLFDISLTISPVRDAAGRIIGASKIARDISDRKRIENAIESLNSQLTADLSAVSRMQQLSTRLVEANDFHQLLGEIIDAGIEITSAAKGNIQLLEAGALRIVSHRGFDQPFLDFFNKTQRGEAAWSLAVLQKQRVVIEDIATSPVFNAPSRDFMLAAGVRAVQATPLISRSGELLGVFSTHYRAPHQPAERELRLIDVLARQAADLIERKRAETALLASEGRFRHLADAMPQIVWTAQPNGFVDYYNERWYQFSGFSRDGHDSWYRIIHPDDLPSVQSAWDHAIATGERLQIECRLWDRNQKGWCWFITRALAVRDTDNSILKWFGTSTDIDEQKRVQEELRRANRDLEQFAYSASHDLQEPLRSIKIYGQLLTARHGEKLEGQAREFLDYLTTAASRMEMLVRDLLAYTQVLQQEEASPGADARDALTAALDSLSTSIAGADATVTAGPLPELGVHHTHLVQVFQNLIGNAIKYRHPQRKPAVEITARRENDHWVFMVRDNGIGIDPEYKEHIFGLFKRLHTGDEYSGTGIGLAICQRIVDRYHGRIWVESEPGHGSAFFFTLPA